MPHFNYEWQHGQEAQRKDNIRQEAYKNMEHVRKFSTEQLQAKIEDKEIKTIQIYLQIGKTYKLCKTARVTR